MIKRSALALSLVLACLLPSCMDSFYDYGRINPSRRAWAIFEQGEVLTGYQYFITGPEGRPDAVVAVAPGYTLKSRIWTPVSPGHQQLLLWADLLGRNPERQPYLRGGILEDFKGNAVGYWYSSLPRSTVKVRKNQVEVGKPEAQPSP